MTSFDPTRSPFGPFGRWLREPLNALTHALGVVLALAGGTVLIVLAVPDARRVVAFAVYAATLVCLYVASTLLHAVRARPPVLRWLRIFDHAAIYLLIAGTYTPVTLVTLADVSPAWGWALFGVAWGFAGLGVVFKILWLGAPRWLSTTLYVGMGWMALVAIAPLVEALPWGGFAWLLAGGAFYSVGALVYARQRPNPWPNVFGYHEIWHLFVLAGSVCHFVLMLRYVLPA